MENEKIIFLDPEEELNEVHERLKNANAGHVILVVPPQTQLQHLVEWRLLHKWVRDLPQDVQINSYDQQIRAKAKAAGFRVAASLESPPSESPRLINRPVRRDTSGKLSHGTNKQRNIGSRASRSLRSGQPQMPLPASENSSTLSSSGDMNREFDSAASSTFEIEDIPYDSHDVPDNSHYALPIEPVSHTQSAAGDQEDGEFDSMAEDYYVARSIREAAQSFDSSVSSSNIDYTGTASGKLHQSSEIPQPDQLEDDPFAYMEDIQPIALREQRASTFIHDLDQGIPDISDIPTEMHDVDLKNLSDEQESVIKHDWSSRTWNDHMLDVSGGQETSHIDSMSPLNSRMGNTMRPAFEDLEKEDDLIGLSDQQTRVPPLSPISSPGASTPSTARYEPQPILQPSRQTSKVSINSNVQQSKKPGATKK